MKLVNIRNVLSLPIDVVEKKYAEAHTKYIEACKNSISKNKKKQEEL